MKAGHLRWGKFDWRTFNKLKTPRKILEPSHGPWRASFARRRVPHEVIIEVVTLPSKTQLASARALIWGEGPEGVWPRKLRHFGPL